MTNAPAGPLGAAVRTVCDVVTAFFGFLVSTPVRRAIMFVLVLVAIALIAGMVLPHDFETARDYLAVFVLGAVIGVSDVFSRYQEAPLRTLGTPGALTRIATNAAASGLALWLIKTPFGPGPLTISNPAAQIVAAGFGALALLRISLRFRFSGQDVSIGPADLIDSILAAGDRDANRASTVATARDAYEVRRKVLYPDIVRRLAPICVEFPQTLSAAQRQELYANIKASVDRVDCGEAEKSLLVLAVIARVVGWEVVKGVADEIARDGDPTPIEALVKQSERA